ncbi:MAG: hydantoinase/oxoprolinase family protein, partial [Candidatus Rokubacteria bacterium]|nr:hydantoinase/oxoprolinase family protein [Candidatus Rokubacteria bacterium]
MTRYALGCDIGGTFTDFILVDLDTGDTVVDKCLTTPDDPTRAVMEGVGRLAAQRPGLASDLDRVVHGTTLMINAIIERKGAPTALVTTEGFRDIVEIGREKRYDVYDIWAQFPRPLAPRRWRREVAERVYSDGRVLRPLDEEGARRELRALATDGVESIAVSLLHAYANPVHEQTLETLAREVAPGLFVSLSSDVLPEIREYERTCTTLANAYVKPIAARYLATLIEELQRAGFRRRLYIMLSSGGVTSVDAAQRYPVRVIESGPAGGATAGEFLARGLDAADLLAFDMGGTTAKCCVISDGQAGKTSECEVARIHRFKKGSGIPLKIPMVDLVEIGAGGGSIAHV